MNIFLLLDTLLAIAVTKCSANSTPLPKSPPSSVLSLLETHADTIQQLIQIAQEFPSAFTNENNDSMFYLR